MRGWHAHRSAVYGMQYSRVIPDECIYGHVRMNLPIPPPPSPFSVCMCVLVRESNTVDEFEHSLLQQRVRGGERGTDTQYDLGEGGGVGCVVAGEDDAGVVYRHSQILEFIAQ